jgi:hypothetical protein
VKMEYATHVYYGRLPKQNELMQRQ